MIYPQRMELTGNESLMDILHMVPELMIVGYEDVIGNYNLRIDNCPMNGDTKLILSQMKAKDIATIQVCDNTGVAKGTIEMGRVLDINMIMPDTLKGFVEGLGDFGKDVAYMGTANALYGSKHTDLYANTSYRHQNGNEEYLTLHMTNRFDNKNRLLTYFTQHYIDSPSATARKVLGRARFFHTFNDMGTELLIVGSYQYASDHVFSKKLPMFNIELNTPLLNRHLNMMVGIEGDYLTTSQKNSDKKWHVFNNDFYMQFTYSLPKWRLTAGNRVMLYNYKLFGQQSETEGQDEGKIWKRHNYTRNNTNACAIFVPDSRNQFQLGYYHKFYNPYHESVFMNITSLSDDIWYLAREKLDDTDINQLKLAYAYSKQKLTVQTALSYYMIENGENFTELGTSAYWKTNMLSLVGGTDLYLTKSGTYASFRLAPSVDLPNDWRIGMQIVYYTKNSIEREITGVPVYGCLSVNKPLGKNWLLGVDWHDMFDAVCSEAKQNRHAAAVKMQFIF